MSNKQVKIWVGIMFFFLISLVFLCDKCHAESLKDTKTYFRYYAMGQDMAITDYKHYKLWQHYQHKMKETLKEQAFREGYLDKGAYLAMPIINKVKYNLESHEWVEAYELKRGK